MLYIRALLYLPFLIITTVGDWILGSIYLLYYHSIVKPAYYFYWKADIKRIQIEMDHVYKEHKKTGATEKEAKKARIDFAYAHAKTFKGFIDDKARKKHTQIQNRIQFKRIKKNA